VIVTSWRALTTH